MAKFANCGGRNRTCGLVVQSHEFLPAETTPQWEEGRVGLEPTRGCLTNTCSAAELPTRSSALWESNPPVQLGRLTPWPIGQGHMFLFKAEAVGLEPTTGVSPAPAFEAGSSSSWMTSMSGQAAVAGLEPAFVSLTASRLTIGPHRNSWQSAWSDLNRRSRAPEARGFPDFPTR